MTCIGPELPLGAAEATKPVHAGGRGPLALAGPEPLLLHKILPGLEPVRDREWLIADAGRPRSGIEKPKPSWRLVVEALASFAAFESCCGLGFALVACEATKV